MHWTSPSLVAEVAFTEWTGDGQLRHPVFKGLREDKPAAEVVRELEKPAPERAAASRRHAATPARPALRRPARPARPRPRSALRRPPLLPARRQAGPSAASPSAIRTASSSPTPG